MSDASSSTPSLKFQVRSEAVYKYLTRYVENNNFLMDGCRRNFINYQLKAVNVFDNLGIYSVDILCRL